jgi:hypothetical protein
MKKLRISSFSCHTFLSEAIPRLPALLQGFDHNLFSYHYHNFFRVWCPDPSSLKGLFHSWEATVLISNREVVETQYPNTIFGLTLLNQKGPMSCSVFVIVPIHALLTLQLRNERTKDVMAIKRFQNILPFDRWSWNFYCLSGRVAFSMKPKFVLWIGISSSTKLCRAS